MEAEIMEDSKNVMVMKLLHYFITEKNYKIIKVEKAEQGKCIYNTEEFTFIADSIYSVGDSIRVQVK